MNRFKQSSWMVTAPLVIAAIAYLTLFFLPGMKAIGEVREQIRTKQEYVTQAERLRPIRDNVAKSLEDAQSYTTRWESQRTDPSQLAVVYGQISRLAKASGTLTTRFEPQPAVKYKTLARVPLSFAVTGEIAAIQSLLKGLEELPLSIWVEDVKLHRTGQDTANVVCEMNLAIFTSYNEKTD